MVDIVMVFVHLSCRPTRESYLVLRDCKLVFSCVGESHTKFKMI